MDPQKTKGELLVERETNKIFLFIEGFSSTRFPALLGDLLLFRPDHEASTRGPMGWLTGLY